MIGGGFHGNYAPVISSFNPIADDTGAVRLDAASLVSDSFVLRQGTLLVRHSSGLGTGSDLYIGDGYTTSGANARLLTDASGVTISQNITIRALEGHQVNATVGGNQTAGQSIFSGTITLNRDTSFTSANTDGDAVVFNNVIGGLGGITKIGSGTVVFNDVNSYQGNTTIDAGRLRLGAAGALPTSTAVTMANVSGAILDLNGYSQTIASLSGGGGSGGDVYLGSGTLTVGSGNYAGVISGSGGVTKVGAGTLTLSGPNQYTGLTLINAGTLGYGANNVLGSGSVTVDGSTAVLDIGNHNDTVGTLTLDNGGQISGSGGTLSSDSAFQLKNGTVTAKLGGTAALSKTTDGTVTLSAPNTFTGDTRIQAGTLTLGHSLALQNSTVDMDVSDTGILNLNNLDVTLGGLKGARDLQIPDGKTLSVGYNNSSTSYGGKLGGTGVTMEKVGSGTFVFTANHSYTGLTKISAGVLQIGNGGTSGWIDTSVENNGSLCFNRSDDVNFRQPITGTGSLTKYGPGTLTLSANNSYAGDTIVASGTLLINGTHSGSGSVQVGTLGGGGAVLGGTGSVAGNVAVLSFGGIAPGASIGIFTVGGNVTFEPNSTLQIELDGAGNGSSDLLAVAGSIDISNASVTFGIGSSLDDPAYIFVTYGTLNGKQFYQVNNLPPGYRIDYNYQGLNQIAVVVPEPGISATILLCVSVLYSLYRKFSCGQFIHKT